jgi:hypothetical protein
VEVLSSVTSCEHVNFQCRSTRSHRQLQRAQGSSTEFSFGSGFYWLLTLAVSCSSCLSIFVYSFSILGKSRSMICNLLVVRGFHWKSLSLLSRWEIETEFVSPKRFMSAELLSVSFPVSFQALSCLGVAWLVVTQREPTHRSADGFNRLCLSVVKLIGRCVSGPGSHLWFCLSRHIFFAVICIFILELFTYFFGPHILLVCSFVGGGSVISFRFWLVLLVLGLVFCVHLYLEIV